MKNKVLVAMGIGITAALAASTFTTVDAKAEESQLTDDEIKDLVVNANGNDVVLDESTDNTDYTKDNDTNDKIEITQEAGAWDIVDQSTLQEGDSGLTDPTKVAEITITDHIADGVTQDVIDDKYTDPNDPDKYALTDTTEKAVKDKIAEIESDSNSKVVEQTTDATTGDVTLDIETTRTDDEMRDLVDKAITDLGKDNYVVDETEDITTDTNGNITVVGHKDVSKSDDEMNADIDKAKAAITTELEQYGTGDIDWKKSDPDPTTGDVTITGTLKVAKGDQSLVDALLAELGSDYTLVSATPDPNDNDLLVITVSHEIERPAAAVAADIDAAKKELEAGTKTGEKLLSIDDSKKSADGKQQIITATYYNERLDELSGIGGDCDNLLDNQGSVDGKIGYRHETGNGTQNPGFDKDFWNGVINDVIANGSKNGVNVFVYDGTDANGLMSLIKEVSDKNLDMSNVIIVAKNKLGGNLVLPDLGGKSFGTLLLNPDDNDGIKIEKDANGNLVSNHIHLQNGAKLTVGDMSHILKDATKRTETKEVDLYTTEQKEYKKDRYDKYSEDETVKGKKTVDSEPITIDKVVKSTEIVKKQYSVESTITRIFYANLKSDEPPVTPPGGDDVPPTGPTTPPTGGGGGDTTPTFTAPVAAAPAPAAEVLGARRSEGGSVLGARRSLAPAVLGKKRAPETGDTMAVFGWLTALMGTLTGAGVSAKALKKSKKEDAE